MFLIQKKTEIQREKAREEEEAAKGRRGERCWNKWNLSHPQPGQARLSHSPRMPPGGIQWGGHSKDWFHNGHLTMWHSSKGVRAKHAPAQLWRSPGHADACWVDESVLPPWQLVNPFKLLAMHGLFHWHPNWKQVIGSLRCHPKPLPAARIKQSFCDTLSHSYSELLTAGFFVVERFDGLRVCSGMHLNRPLTALYLMQVRKILVHVMPSLWSSPMRLANPLAQAQKHFDLPHGKSCMSCIEANKGPENPQAKW